MYSCEIKITIQIEISHHSGGASKKLEFRLRERYKIYTCLTSIKN